MAPTLRSPTDCTFPRLTPAQVARVAARGKVRSLKRGEVLLQPGEPTTRFYVVTSTVIEIIRQSAAGHELLAVLEAGMFTAELTMLSGRPGFVLVQAREAGEVIEVDRDNLIALVQTDPEVSEVLMRAFILRHVALVAKALGDVVLIGSAQSADTLRIKLVLKRRRHPYTYLDLDHDDGLRAFIDRFHLAAGDLPMLICRGGVILRNPTSRRIGECLGLGHAVARGAGGADQ